MSEYTVPEEIKQRNRELCARYPFLIPTNRWSGKRITDCAAGEKGFWPGNPDEIPEYDYERTELDDMPDGWRKAFGEAICQEIMDELVAHNLVDDYRITQIKEKWGFLHWYDNGCTSKIWKEIIPKYEELSMRTCIHCGKPATKISTGWISPWCDECAKDIRDRMVPIEEYFNPPEEDVGEEEDPV